MRLHAVLLRPLEYTEPDRLVRLFTANPSEGWYYMPVSYPNYSDWREQNESFADMGIYTYQVRNLTGEGDPERVVTVRARTRSP